ncbi:MAG: hypothetical protein UR66_C0003G0076 [Candidatus Moranbacteria bacterium GW2011_GWE1_35_17]|nr:MAG: hypothetical protein UR66_C0003G0076 [Candidatus Moranbacteria bacterium GW2011_GWE1_35_17]KKP81494.1 MAG: hypothetical protein UR83_C0074G0006 [Candidatus Moranbacteria bacterium GW2011_GWF2_35_54]KKP82510.1 MAG: hypothetical protein UR82_C0037G0007 [Candidatus Moranbacteria bacterium GW2011_GWF1_35_5]
MDKDNCIDAVKDVLLDKLNEGNKYWSREEEIADQIRIIKEIEFLKDEMIRNTIEEKMDSFSGDIWELTEELFELLRDKAVALPSADALAVLILYIFYTEKPLDLSVV